MIIIHEDAVRWLNRLSISLIVCMAVMCFCVLVLLGTLIKERREHIESVQVAKDILTAADDKMTQREDHVRYLKEEVNKWHKRNWKPIPAGEKD